VKSIVSTVIGCLAGVLFCIIGSASVKAYAYENKMYVNVEHMTAAEAASYSGSGVTITANDLKCTVKYHDLAQFSGLGSVVEFNSQYYSAVTEANSTSTPYTIDLNYSAMSTGCNNSISPGRVSFAYMSTTMGTMEGEAAIFFLRPKSNNIPVNTSVIYNCLITIMIDTNSQDIIPGVSSTNPLVGSQGFNICLPFTVGDLSGDGDCDMGDIMILWNALHNAGWNANAPQNTLTISAAPGMYGTDPLVSGSYFIPDAADVNCDGVIDSTDLSLMQDYYDDYVLFYLTGDEYIGSAQVYECGVNP
jgi:hypothetical protein